jgi:hypothetical protein
MSEQAATELMHEALKVCYYRDKNSINKFQLAKVGPVGGPVGAGGQRPPWHSLLWHGQAARPGWWGAAMDPGLQFDWLAEQHCIAASASAAARRLALRWRGAWFAGTACLPHLPPGGRACRSPLPA